MKKIIISKETFDKLNNKYHQGGTVDSNIKALAEQYGIPPEQVIQILQEGAKKKKQGYSYYQEGGEGVPQEQPSPEQIVQAYAEISGQDPQQIIQQLQQMPPEQQQEALGQMLQTLQQGQSQMQQEGGQSGVPQQQGGIDPQQIAQALQQGADPNQVIEQLIQQGLGHEEAMSIVQQVVQQLQGAVEGQPQMREGGKVKRYEDGGTTEDPKKVMNVNRETYAHEPILATTLPYSMPDIAGEDIWKGENYKSKWIPFVEETMKDPKKAALIEQRLLANTGKYGDRIRENLKGLTGQDRLNKIKDLATDKQVGVFHNAFLDAAVETQPQPVFEQPTTQPEKIRRDVVKNVLYDKGLPYVMPPSAAIAPYLQQVNLSRLEGQKGSVENQLQASENARQALYAATAGMPPAQRAAVLASSLATSGQQDVQGIAAQEIQDLQNKARIEQYNASQADKEQLLNERLKEAYERKALQTLNVNEANWRNYFDTQQANQKAVADEIARRNILNLGLENYQLTGSGGFEFVNRSPFQQQDPQAAAYLKWFNTLSPEQQIAERKKQYELMSKKV